MKIPQSEFCVTYVQEGPKRSGPRGEITVILDVPTEKFRRNEGRLWEAR